ncbi:MAG TPA: CatA-like O-acetyltransferase [Humidesulfovibrio sp.]|uniref:CatA-like O-acetyltransferase n=1 Tax=Humidesulfovibrio sp. TaxID=2910988 RepID=UPI002B887B3D|nr:CatA-like O-acetyltransferase [Humidesulfovibrio sp.]HWR02836.1 CatA-like O-acetyltransferase [Humidesulfovibrio sp.]
MKRIDMETWGRRDQYRYFSAMQWPYWSLTCEVDVTRAREFMNQRGVASYLGMIYLVTKAANAVPELRLRIQDGEVYEHEVVHPSFTLLAHDGELRFCAARYQDDPNAFLADTRAQRDRIKHADAPPLAATAQDVLYISCLPWVHFTSVSHPMPQVPQDSIPRIVWGRFQPRGEAIVLAVNLHLHHGLADGLHASRFMLGLEELCADPERGFAGLKLQD